jgi:hypothetical protein
MKKKLNTITDGEFLEGFFFVKGNVNTLPRKRANLIIISQSASTGHRAKNLAEDIQFHFKEKCNCFAAR